MTREQLIEKLTTSDSYDALREAGYKFKEQHGAFENLEPLPGKRSEGFCTLPGGKEGYRDVWGGTWEKV